MVETQLADNLFGLRIMRGVLDDVEHFLWLKSARMILHCLDKDKLLRKVMPSGFSLSPWRPATS